MYWDSQNFLFTKVRFGLINNIFLYFQGKHEFDPETEEALLLGEDFDEEEEEEDGRSWKR